MLGADVVDALAERLDQAERTKVPLPHFSIEFPEITIDDAYRIQAAWMARKVAAGRTVAGHKIGLTSRVMQESVGIHEPDYGVLLDDMVYGDGAVIPFDRFIQPRIEVELCFVLADALRGPGCTIFDVLDATAYVTPAMEIITTRFHRFDPETKAPRKITDTIADNAANGAMVVGGRPVRPLDVDLRWVAALLYRNEAIELTGVAAAVLNHPATGVAWLADKLALHGEQLEPGELVLSGSFTAASEVRRGDVYHADYGPLGTVSCTFS